MEDLNLTETEMRYFGDLFLCCDEESNGKIPILKATELFRSSNISNEVLKQIMDISVAPNICASMNHLNRKQFYSALKLIAAHQTNVVLSPEVLSTPLDLPLPRFTWALNSEASADLIQLSSSPKEQYIPKRERKFAGNSSQAYEPMRLSSNLSDSDVPQTLSHDNTEALSTDSEMESETLSQRSGSRGHGRRGKNGSPWSTASESPTPTNSVAERVHPVWEHSATGRGVWPANTTEEHTRLLGTEEESSDRHSSDEEGEGEDMWTISDAQARHYAAQFQQLRPERGLLPGHTARLFFEKSRLTVADLRKIWLLADINKDGMLSLEEFSIAMHLIVLRRNNVPVPDVLPTGLVPQIDSRYSQRSVTTDLVDLGPDMFGSGTSADFNFNNATTVTTTATTTSAKPDPKDDSSPKERHSNNKEWTKFVDSPTSSVSSPGPKPVNFDFHKSAVERDPKIFHPVALRVTPEGGGEGDGRAAASPRDVAFAFEPAPVKRAPPQPQPVTVTDSTPVAADIRPVQRPQPKKPAKSFGALPPPPAPSRDTASSAPEEVSGVGMGRKEPPPPPPPRPLRQHARSSSLDLNRLAGAPPVPPPRTSPPAGAVGAPRALHAQRSEGDATQAAHAAALRDFDDDGFGYRGGAGGAGAVPKMHGAFEVYRKPGASPHTPDVRALHEQNAVLRRVCRALQHELADVQRDRHALQIRLNEHHTPV